MGQAVGDLSSSTEESPQGSQNESLMRDVVNGTSLTYTPVQVATTLSFAVGFWQVGVLADGFRGDGSINSSSCFWNWK